MNKKLFSLLLAILMVAVSLGAMAANDTTQIPESGVVPVETSFDIAKTYTGAGKPEETFKFTIEPQNGAPSFGNDASQKIAFTAKSGETETLTVNLPNYPARPGVYNYTIKEETVNTLGITTDTKTYTLKVTVYNAAELGADPVYKTTIAIKDTSNNKQVNAAFTNTYSATQITDESDEGKLLVQKKLAGNAADVNETFTLTVTFAAPEDSVLKSAIQYSAPDGVTVKNDGLTYTIEGIKGGEQVTFANLPAGTQYKVVEPVDDDGTAKGYMPTYAGCDSSIDADAVNTAVVTNTKTTEIDTGVNTDSMPYILLMALVAIMAVAYVAKKRAVR